MDRIQELMGMGNYRYGTLAEAIFNALVKGISNGLFKEGEQLIEAELQKHFGVSKSPIREALKDLSNLGLVEIKPRRGAFIKVIKKSNIVENYKIRAFLEALAAKEAYNKISPKALDEMTITYSKMEEATKNNDTKKYWEYHHLFHDSYLKTAELPTLSRILNNLRIQNLWYRNQFYSTDIRTDLLTHLKIYEHFRKHDITEKRIEDMVRKHIEKGLDNFLKFIIKIQS